MCAAALPFCSLQIRYPALQPWLLSVAVPRQKLRQLENNFSMGPLPQITSHPLTPSLLQNLANASRFHSSASPLKASISTSRVSSFRSSISLSPLNLSCYFLPKPSYIQPPFTMASGAQTTGSTKLDAVVQNVKAQAPANPTGLDLYSRFALAGAFGCAITHGALTPVDVYVFVLPWRAPAFAPFPPPVAPRPQLAAPFSRVAQESPKKKTQTC